MSALPDANSYGGQAGLLLLRDIVSGRRIHEPVGAGQTPRPDPESPRSPALQVVSLTAGELMEVAG